MSLYMNVPEQKIHRSYKVRSVYYYCSCDTIAPVPVPVPAPDEQGLAGDEVGTVVDAIGWLVE